jgi:ribonucrease Y
MFDLNSLLLVISALVLCALAFLIGFYIQRVVSRRKRAAAENEAQTIIAQAQHESEDIKKEARVQAKEYKILAKEELENEVREKRNELRALETRLVQRETSLDNRTDSLDKKEIRLQEWENKLNAMEKKLTTDANQLAKILEDQNRHLEMISGLSSDEAKNILIENMRGEAEREASIIIKRILDEAKEKGDREAKEIIALAIQRYASDYVSESTVSVVELPSEEMKGRIIGREGRNIRALEAATGVDLIIDDTPEAVIISSFDPIRRKIAQMSLERLILDGRIHPARIEEIVDKVRTELDNIIKETGEQIVFDVALTGVHPEAIKLLGRLKFRTSYGQNVLQHSREVAYLAGMMASELGIDFEMARRAGLLHDIGKAVDAEVEGTHAQIGSELAQKYGESRKVVNAIAAHHEQEEPLSMEAILIQAADAISAARPGARRETLEGYLKRMTKLEEIAGSFTGVNRTFAIQAGRELRVMVEAETMDDAGMAELCRSVAKRIEDEMEYPGKIKVVAIRESRAVEYAK